MAGENKQRPIDPEREIVVNTWAEVRAEWNRTAGKKDRENFDMLQEWLKNRLEDDDKDERGKYRIISRLIKEYLQSANYPPCTTAFSIWLTYRRRTIRNKPINGKAK